MTLFVRLGKGRKDRVVPIGERALRWCDKYRQEVRPELVMLPDEGFFFLTQTGERILEKRLTGLVHEYVKAASLGKTGSCHLFRHTMATVMLENGADIRYIQQMLGHANLETTEVYTHVSIQDLQAIHRKTHPSALLSRHADKSKKIEAGGKGRVERGSDLSSLYASLDAESERDPE
jgi:integrase/recombinase XerD